MTQQLLARHGVLTREAVSAEAVPGGFGIVYPVLKGLEDNGRIRRGYFVAGLGATQFAMPGALDLLRSMRDAPDEAEIAVLAATDPANPYGATLKWTSRRSTQTPQNPSGSASSAVSALDVVDSGRGPTRSVGATVILVNGALAAYLVRGDRQLLTFLPEAEPDRSENRPCRRAGAHRSRAHRRRRAARHAHRRDRRGAAAAASAGAVSGGVGFVAGAMGFQATFRRGSTG